MAKKTKMSVQLVSQNDEQTSYSGAEELWANERYLVGYNSDIVRKLSHGSVAGCRVLEFGAGIGTLANLWTSKLNSRPDCVEIDPELRKILLSRDFRCYQKLDDVCEKFDVIYTSNVLEHIEDDSGAMRNLYDKIEAGGRLAVYVPAFSCLYSDFDAAVGHHRRYERRELLGKLRAANFWIERCEYVDSLGFFAWLSTKWKSYDSSRKFGGGSELRVYDRFIYPVSRLLDALGFKHIFGKNLLVIAKKP